MLAWYRARTTTFSKMTVVMKPLKSLLSTARRASCMQEERCAETRLPLARHEAGSTSNKPAWCMAAQEDTLEQQPLPHAEGRQPAASKESCRPF